MNVRAKAKMELIPWPDINERRKDGLSACDHERKTWRICGITIDPPALTEDKKIAVEKKTIYAVMNNTDGNEGRGRQYPMHFTESVGRLANAELRRAKSAAHAAFDPLWQRRPTHRRDAYAWLAEQLGIAVRDCHIGEFDLELCRRVVAVCTSATIETGI